MEGWSNSAPYTVAVLSDRAVPVPRDPDAPYSLYALSRAWVRNDPSIPLSASGPSPLVPELHVKLEAGGDDAAQEGQQQQQQQQETRQQHQQALMSILPPPLPPTPLETDTLPPAYLLDDFEALEPEDALRKFKDHWVGVRQYHQAARRAKLSRYRERLHVLLGEPSAPQQRSAVAAQAQGQQLLLLQQQLAGGGSMAAALAQAGFAGAGAPGLGGPGGGGGQAQAQAAAHGLALAPGSAEALLRAQDPANQAQALAAILGLAQQFHPGGAAQGEAAAAASQQQQQQQALGVGGVLQHLGLANGDAQGHPQGVVSLEMLLALLPQGGALSQQQQQTQEQQQQQQPALGQLPAGGAAAEVAGRLGGGVSGMEGPAGGMPPSVDLDKMEVDAAEPKGS
ncbi:hypothetical protein TSOC_002013 [Tetrabaena socialis]|uniref:Uncharacterized protein n=1 Tax=Tetrabaena socialis TaxID=47790 RepID=A0A2J8AF65_9CHLO|nr:hypothetical protein TSOC_002013 [Tetrabaena socialis]|eukprot:PNH11161.1 hypothetical protein TSOC_002013 [Tetrabaena socialis]